MNIHPSLLALADKKDTWTESLARVDHLTTGIHYDIGDGEFVPSLMLAPADIHLVHSPRPIDAHLMVKNPSTYYSELLTCPSLDAIAFHVECDEDIHENIQFLHNAGKKAGLAVLSRTPVDHLDQYLLEADYILVMTIVGGYSGTPFLLETLDKIRAIHNKNPDLPIMVDGGVNKDTLPLCQEAWATAAVMSSALFNSEDISWIEKFL
jgi:ribulose-phosphate 3-epimerase